MRKKNGQVKVFLLGERVSSRDRILREQISVSLRVDSRNSSLALANAPKRGRMRVLKQPA